MYKCNPILTLNEKYINSLSKVRTENYGKGAISNINSNVYIFRTERNPYFIFAISARQNTVICGKAMMDIQNGEYFTCKENNILLTILFSCPIMFNNLLDSTGAVNLQEENLKLRDQVICKICHSAYVSSMFLPCTHLVCCSDCAPVCRTCPVCSKNAETVIKVQLK